MDPLRPDRLQLHAASVSKPKLRTRRPRHKRGAKFFMGPIPLSWLAKAGRQPGRALHVAVVLWFKAGLSRTGEVKLSLSNLGWMGVSRDQSRRG